MHVSPFLSFQRLIYESLYKESKDGRKLDRSEKSLLKNDNDNRHNYTHLKNPPQKFKGENTRIWEWRAVNKAETRKHGTGSTK
jgi:hypothetical protein